ncbi:MAG: transglycosylase SLT domain-containing protein [Alphaproteobacteria bacterium]|nr:transglycosylase SLT domain-containing protein [Alphaproteobacteria bacterium]
MDTLPIKEQFHDSSLCLVAAKKASNKFGVSYDLLQTISAVESGVWSNIRNTYVAWPWTVNVNGKGYYYETKADAVAAVKKFQADGFQSIDVGCMQINLKYHGSAFSSVEDALDPLQNVKYSAKFLRTLYSQSDNNWEKAAKKYHSANPIEGTLYSKRLQNRFESYKVAGLAQNLQLF